MDSPCGMWMYLYFGTHDGMSASLIKYDLQNYNLEVKKVNMCCRQLVSDIKIV